MKMLESSLGDVLTDEFLAEAAVFSHMTAGDVRPCLQALGCTAYLYEAGEDVLALGDTPDYYPVVMQGSVSATIDQGGKSRHIVTVGGGDSFAEAIPMMGLPSPVTVRACEACVVLRVPVAALDASNDPAARLLRANISQRMSAKVGTLVQNISVIGQPRAEARILAYLRGLPKDERGFAKVPFASHREWADYLRMDEKTLSRKLADLRTGGMVKVSEGLIALTPEGLAACDDAPNAGLAG